jgi:pimeloyl-ACP methyl ester carboxylesterase
VEDEMRLAHLILVALFVAAAGCSDDPGQGPTPDGAPLFDHGVAKPDLLLPDGELLPDAPPSPLTWGPCDTSVWPDGYPKPGASVECTTIDVPLDHDQPGGATITLRVGRQRSTSHPTGKAVFHLAGGPGGAATYQSGTIPYYMPGLLASFDMIYVDQRGTGGSGRLDCPAGYPYTAQEWTTCAAALAGEPLDHLLTLDAARDLDLVRKRLGYDKIYIRGGSYGTRLGLEYIRQFGDKVVAAVLDGLAPPDWDIFGYDVGALQQAVDKLVQDCNADTACTAVVPDLKADLDLRRQQAVQQPKAKTVGGQTFYEDEQYFLMFLFAMLDYTKLRYKVPRAIHQSVQGNEALWNQQLSLIFGTTVADAKAEPPLRGQVNKAPRIRLPERFRRPARGVEYVASGLLATVMCAEWFPNAGGLSALQTKLGTQSWVTSDTLAIPESCASWNVTPVAASLRQPVSSTVKTLLLSGEIDLRTPPAMGDQAAKTLPNSTHLVVPYASHSTISVSCASQILIDFFKADGEMSKVSTACLKQVTHPGW